MQEKDYKLIVTDMDGTLLNDDKKISERNIEAIRKVREKGIRFAFVSGREYVFLEKMAKEYEIDVDAIGLNGTEIRNDKGEIIWKRLLDRNTVKDILKVLEDEDMLFKIYCENEILGTVPKRIDELITKLLMLKIKEDDITEDLKSEEYQRLFGRGLTVTDISSYIDEYDYNVEKIEVLDADRELLNKISEKINNVTDVFITSSYERNIEILHKDVNKGSAIKRFGEYLGIDSSQIMAFGDNTNDIEMLEVAGLGIAMENALDHVKEKADYITLSNENDGVAYAINKFIR